MTDPTLDGMPYRIALVLDGKVEEIFYCSQELAAKMLSSATFYEIPENVEVNTGYSFDGTNFLV